MRLSDIRGDRVLDVVADIAGPACAIAADPTARRLFARGDRPEGVTPEEHALRKVGEALPVLLREHKDEVIAILASIEGVDPQEYREGLTMSTLFQGLYEMMTDEDLLAFLR